MRLAVVQSDYILLQWQGEELKLVLPAHCGDQCLQAPHWQHLCEPCPGAEELRNHGGLSQRGF